MLARGHRQAPGEQGLSRGLAPRRLPFTLSPKTSNTHSSLFLYHLQ